MRTTINVFFFSNLLLVEQAERCLDTRASDEYEIRRHLPSYYKTRRGKAKEAIVSECVAVCGVGLLWLVHERIDSTALANYKPTEDISLMWDEHTVYLHAAGVIKTNTLWLCAAVAEQWMRHHRFVHILRMRCTYVTWKHKYNLWFRARLNRFFGGQPTESGRWQNGVDENDLLLFFCQAIASMRTTCVGVCAFKWIINKEKSFAGDSDVDGDVISFCIRPALCHFPSASFNLWFAKFKCTGKIAIHSSVRVCKALSLAS